MSRLTRFKDQRYKKRKSYKTKIASLKASLSQDDFIIFLEKHDFNLYKKELDNRVKPSLNDFNKENEKILSNKSYSNEYKFKYLESRHRWLESIHKDILSGGLISRTK